MDDEEPFQPRFHHRPPSQSQVQGMESVVATVSGYHGAERFNLIKLISQAGANYVGSMTKSTTHLICWNFEGKKYDLAKKLNTFIVNHRWIEDCIKRGMRVPEDSYTLESGQQVGPLILPIALFVEACISDKSKSLPQKSNNLDSEIEMTGSKSRTSGDPVWRDSCLVKELLIDLRSDRSPRKSKLTKAKMNKKYEDKLSSQYSSQKIHLSGSIRTERDKRKISNDNEASSSGEYSHKGRLVRKKADGLETEPLDASNFVTFPSSRISAPSNHSVDLRCENITEVRDLHDGEFLSTSPVMSGGPGGCVDVEEIEDLNTSSKSSNLHEKDFPEGASSSSEKLREDIKDGDKVIDNPRLPNSIELSCVICWTEFSSSRGILPCGHRFCYSCIQDWADRKASTRKPSTCPLCKASFTSIMKVDGAAINDQKVYSQTIPCDSSIPDVVFVMDQERPNYGAEVAVCSVCRHREPEDLLVSCHLCQNRQIHSYCLDPPLFPWTCSHCKDLRILYQQSY